MTQPERLPPHEPDAGEPRKAMLVVWGSAGVAILLMATVLLVGLTSKEPEWYEMGSDDFALGDYEGAKTFETDVSYCVKSVDGDLLKILRRDDLPADFGQDAVSKALRFYGKEFPTYVISVMLVDCERVEYKAMQKVFYKENGNRLTESMPDGKTWQAFNPDGIDMNDRIFSEACEMEADDQES